jgi:hypothetical protein
MGELGRGKRLGRSIRLETGRKFGVGGGWCVARG